MVFDAGRIASVNLVGPEKISSVLLKAQLLPVPRRSRQSHCVEIQPEDDAIQVFLRKRAG